MNRLECDSPAVWRDWLRNHHRGEKEIWLVFRKGDEGKRLLDYDSALDEALCWGWIDSLIKKIDDNSYARKFTPRNDVSKWSPINKGRVERLIIDERMEEPGLAVIRAAKANGCWDKPDRPPAAAADSVPEEFEAALKRNAKAAVTFENLAPSHRKNYILWIAMAKRPETKVKRIEEAVALLENGKKLGLK